MDDDELERFVDDWISSKKQTYFAVERFSGTGDLGRDVVGYQDSRLHEGAWDNFQCKQLKVSLTAPSAMRELAKIFYHCANGVYCLPSRYTFVAPRGVTRTARGLVSQPTKFQAEMKTQWDATCSEHIVEGQRILLDAAIQRTIDSFDFSKVDALDAAKLLKDRDIQPVLAAWFGEDPGEAPRGTVPPEIQAEEAPFISELVAAYSDQVGNLFAGAAAVLADRVYGDDLRLQRVRYFDAASFKRYYRDNVPLDCLPAVASHVVPPAASHGCS
jgi:hypothetical protein